MQKILVSACLLGQPLRYDGRAKALDSSLLAKWREEGRLVAICPEVAGGLPVPRPPAEISQGSAEDVLKGGAVVVDSAGDDVTAAFISGAEQALALCREHGIRVAILTEFSPSCGVEQVNDGSFARSRVAGHGVTTALLRQHDIVIFNQHNLDRVVKWLDENTA